MATEPTRHERTREEHGFVQGLFVEGIRDSVNSVEKVKEVAKVGALGAIGLRLNSLGGVGTGLWLGGGLIAAIYGGWKGYRRAEESQVSFSKRRGALQDEVAGADDKLRKANLAIEKLNVDLTDAAEVLETEGIPPAAPAEVLENLSHEIAQCDLILQQAEEAQKRQKEANKKLEAAHDALLDVYAMPNGDNAERAERLKAVAKATDNLNEAQAERDAINEWLDQTINPEINDIIDQGITDSARLGVGVPYNPTVIDHDRPTYIITPGGSGLGSVNIQIRDYSDIITQARQLRSDATKTTAKITDARDRQTVAENKMLETQAELVKAEDAQRYAHEKYNALMDPDHTGAPLTPEEAETRYERSQRNRRIGAAIGGVATYLTAYFGGGALISAGFDAAFVGPDSGFNTGMNYLTNDIIEPMTQTPWWQKWF